MREHPALGCFPIAGLQLPAIPRYSRQRLPGPILDVEQYEH